MLARCDNFDVITWKCTLCLTYKYGTCARCPQNINCELADFETRYNTFIMFYTDGEN